jgi:hypothetical protein
MRCFLLAFVAAVALAAPATDSLASQPLAPIREGPNGIPTRARGDRLRDIMARYYYFFVLIFFLPQI